MVAALTGTTPEGVTTGNPGDMITSTDGSVWVKATGTGNTGWGKAASASSGLGRMRSWTMNGNAATVTAVGMTAPTAIGTATTRNVATTNVFTQVPRLGYVSAAVAASLAGPRGAALQFFRGNAASLGGFRMRFSFGISDAVFSAAGRMFLGMTGSIAAPTNVEPSTLTNCFGIGHGAADTTLRIYSGNAGAGTPVDLGVNFPANTTNTHWYQVEFVALSNTATMTYEVRRAGTTFVATGTITTPPVNTQLLGIQMWRTNNAAAVAVGLDVGDVYAYLDY
jgi:hypothetical protein